MITIDARRLLLIIAIALVLGAIGGVWAQMWKGCL